MGQPNWTIDVYKNILAPSNSMAWPGVTLGAAPIQVGDYGPLPNMSSTFQYAGNVFSDGLQPETESVLAGNWSRTYGNFTQTRNGASADGSYWDSETNTEVEGGLAWGWMFGKGENIIANLPQTNSTKLVDPDSFLASLAPNSAIYAAASDQGYLGNNKQIKPGFAIVVEVFSVVSGLVVCSTAENQEFSVSGVASAMNLFMEGEVGGYYGKVSEISNTQVFIWPQQAVTQDDPSNVASTSTQGTIAYRAYTWNGNGGFQEYKPH